MVFPLRLVSKNIVRFRKVRTIFWNRGSRREYVHEKSIKKQRKKHDQGRGISAPATDTRRQRIMLTQLAHFTDVTAAPNRR
jgi:hypothetical protein